MTSPDEAMVGQMISVPVNAGNLAAYAMDKIDELGFEAGVAALFALGGDIEVPAAVLIPMSTKAIEDGIKHMGLHPDISAAIAGGFKITTYGKVLWNTRRDAFSRWPGTGRPDVCREQGGRVVLV